MKCLFIIFLLAIFSAGCAPCPEVEKQKEAPATKKPSIAREVINGFTGKTAVDDLQRAKRKINAAGETEKQKQQDIDELIKP